MFTGIVEEVGKVLSLSHNELTISAEIITTDLSLGDSISVNGACLTVMDKQKHAFTVQLMEETKRRTNIGTLKTGDKVNLERAMQLGGRMGGHIVQGHVDGTGKVISITAEEGAKILQIEAPQSIMKYVVEKGFIAVNGISLTVVNHTDNAFRVSIVEYTRTHTTLSDVKIGDIVNLEVDIIAKYVEKLIGREDSGITAEFLRKYGF